MVNSFLLARILAGLLNHFTHSEAEEPYRKVVVTLKKGVREWNHNSYNTKRYRANDSKREFTKKYGANTKDYSTDYKKDYAAYLEQKKAAKAAALNGKASEKEKEVEKTQEA